ncbi:MAG: leucine--tRNA ligase [DPANN group archaeon]|nr:leucine--tRNA ligase [DPANN group archaeon]
MPIDFRKTQSEQSSDGPRKILDFSKVEKKWQQAWEDKKIFRAKESSKKKKFYNLEMFPYPSATFLHMGHVRNFTIGDVIARFKRMQGFNVLYPFGYDSFGLPAENAAKKAGIHPKKYTEDAIKKITEYLKALGNSYDWSRVIATHEPEYYKWNQWFFLKFLERGLVYRKKAPVNWCSECKSTLANEEVVSGCCWRHEETQVEQKELEQWFLKTTAYADELLKDLDKLNWSNRIKNLQRNWIGKSQGVLIDFKIKGSKNTLQVFTTRPDTIFGVTFVTVSPKHKLISELAKENKSELEKLRTKVQNEEEKDKEGVFTGSYAINPFTNEEVPVYAANFVVAEYGTGAVMAVPAHDKRDFEFAKKYNLKIKPVVLKKEDKSYSFVMGIGESDIKRIGAEIIEKTKSGFFKIKIPFDKLEPYKEFIRKSMKSGFWNEFSTNTGFYFIFKHKDDKLEEMELNEKTNDLIDKYGMTFNNETPKVHPENVYGWLAENDFYKELLIHTSEGVLVNSGQFNGLQSKDAAKAISDFAEKNKFGKRITNYKLRDWLFSRQRYWGTPIPIIYCGKCGAVPVSEKELPVLLPEKVDFKTAGNPIASAKDWTETKCPKCKSPARRETDTMGGFVDSSWYFLRYCSPQENKAPFDKKAVEYWMPVNQYVGGIEHTVGHLIYSRFWTKVLRDMKMLNFDEPFTSLFNQGIVYKDGHKMSKSFGNVVYQTDISKKYGIDTARVFLMSVAAPESDMEWSDSGVEGSFRLLQKISKIAELKFKKLDAKDEHKRNILIKNYTLLLETFRFNLAIIELARYADYLAENPTREGYETLLTLLSPFAPHIAEELWHKIGNTQVELRSAGPRNQRKFQKNFLGQENRQMIFSGSEAFSRESFVSVEQWPAVNEKAIRPDIEQQEQILEKTIEDVRRIIKIVNVAPKKIYLYTIPKELDIYKSLKETLQKEFSAEVEVWANNNVRKYDPEHKAEKAKPGKPGIYIGA